jgi:hypothetical protein
MTIQINNLTISKVWAMPSRWTFTIPPIKRLLSEEMFDGIWVDPFAGENSPASITNDINPARPSTHHMDALEFLKSLDSDSADGILYDPPYSFTQAKTAYAGFGSNKFITRMDYWANCKKEIARIVKYKGKVICFGWNSNGIGKGKGFRMERVLIVNHGGSKNDTLVTVETKNVSTSIKLGKEIFESGLVSNPDRT